MKNHIWILIGVVFALISCKKSEESSLGEPCSIMLNNVAFTRSLNGAMKISQAENSRLIMKASEKTDYFNEPDGSKNYGNAPVLLTKVDNQKPFTFTVKISPTWQETYDAGALYVFLNEKRWFKFAFERDERKLRRMVTVRTTETSDDNNHDVVDSTSVYMKMSSDTKNIGFYYSTDKANWQLVRLFRNEYPAEAWLGISSQSPMGKGNQTIFEDCSLTQTHIKDFRMGV